MPPRKRIPRRPIRLQLRHPPHRRHRLRLTPVPQILIPLPVLVIRITHNRPRIPQTPPRLGIDRPLDVGEIGGQHGHFVAGRLLLRNDVLVPILREGDVRVGLHVVILAAIHPMSQMPRKDRPDGQWGVHLKDVQLVLPPTEHLIRVGRARSVRSVARSVLPFDDLIHHPHPDPLGVFGPRENGGDGIAALVVAIGGDGHVDGPFGGGAGVAAGAGAGEGVGLVAGADAHGEFAGHELVLVDGDGVVDPEAGDGEDDVGVVFGLVARVDDVFEVAVFVADGDGPSGFRDEGLLLALVVDVVVAIVVAFSVIVIVQIFHAINPEFIDFPLPVDVLHIRQPRLAQIDIPAEGHDAAFGQFADPGAAPVVGDGQVVDGFEEADGVQEEDGAD